jgi:hypothetical protein
MGCRRAAGAGGGVGFFVHNSIAVQASAHTEPRAQQDDNELELLWLHLTVRQRRRAAIQLHLASALMPDSAKAEGVVDAAWGALEEAVATKASTAPGALRRPGRPQRAAAPANGPDCRHGTHDEAGAGAWRAGKGLWTT